MRSLKSGTRADAADARRAAAAASMGKSKKKMIPERSNRIFMARLVKNQKMRARAQVLTDLESLTTFCTNKVLDAMGEILKLYVKKGDLTIKPRLAQAALQAILSGDLRNSACTAGADAVVQFNKNRKARPSAKAAAVEVE